MTRESLKTFLITGVSSGLGRAFAAGALAAGHRVIGTVRRVEDAERFAVVAPGRAHPLLLDVTDYLAIPEAVARAEAAAGPVDVLVNNAGYGHEGVLEESSTDDLQRQFAANVFGPVAMIKAVLPGMRARRRGHIVNVTSMGGFITMPGISFYCGSKFALEGISEALGKEVAGFGVRVTALAPGQFRTDWAAAQWTERPAASTITMGSWTLSAALARRRAASSQATPPRPPWRCSRSSRRKIHPCACSWARMPSGWSSRSCTRCERRCRRGRRSPVQPASGREGAGEADSLLPAYSGH